MSCPTCQGYPCLSLSLCSFVVLSVVENCSAQVPSTDTQTRRAWWVGALCTGQVCKFLAEFLAGPCNVAFWIFP